MASADIPRRRVTTENGDGPTTARWWRDGAEQYQPGAGKMAMWLFMASLSMIFGSTIVAYLVVRSNADVWAPPSGEDSVPLSLWFSTLVLFASSVPLWMALEAVRRDDQAGLRKGMRLALILGSVFLFGQTISWVQLIAGRTTEELRTLYVFTFYMMTVTHALHVLGGLIPMYVVLRRAFEGHYDSHYYPGVLFTNMYWHFLGVVWLILFSVLLIFG